MRSTTLFSLIFLLINISLAQNLISNPSFESGRCPRGHSIRPHDFQVDHWFTPDGSTPDFYHKCGKDGAGIPKNWAGHQLPKEGDAYVGIYLKKGMYQENLGTKLESPLIKDSTYLFSFSVANTANADYLATQISIRFSEKEIHFNHITEFDYTQHTFLIPDPKNFNDFSWRTMRLTYKAKGGEQFLYVGPLKSQLLQGKKNKYRVHDEPMLRKAPYVFLDDFRLEPKFKPPTPIYQLADDLSPVKILFEFDDFVLTEAASAALDTLKEFVESHDLQLLVTGSTDSLGTKDYNIDLGQKRAVTVKNYLSFSGVDEQKIKAVSKGEDTPEYANHSEEYRRLNRNVLIEFFRKEQY